MFDIAVIGAGVSGGMIARELSRYHLKICILEGTNDVAMGATKANSAIVHAGFDAKEGTLKAKLNVRGSQLMEQTAKELGVKYQRNGSLVVGFGEADRKELERLLERGRQNGVKDLEILDKEALHRLEPNLTERAVCGLHAPTGAIVCPYELTIAAVGNAMDNGAALYRNFEVCEIQRKDGYYELRSQKESVEEPSGKRAQQVQAKLVINAAGLYADKIAAMVGDDSFTIHPRRGEYLLLDKECGRMLHHTVFQIPSKMGKGVLVTPTVDGNLLLGPTSVDMEEKEDTSVTAEGIEKVMQEAAKDLDGIPFGKTITSFCGLRAVGNTGDFIIRSPFRGFIHVAGMESPGLSSAPAVAEYVAELVREQGVELISKTDFYGVRTPMHHFREASIEEKNRMIRKNPSYGKIVCRCEGITEGEIREALIRNPKALDLDGVKRRTRAQMGRCQGGFCSPRIVELIAEAQEIPVEKVTKSGGESFVNLYRTKEGVK